MSILDWTCGTAGIAFGAGIASGAIHAGLAAGTFEYRRRGETENRAIARDEIAKLIG